MPDSEAKIYNLRELREIFRARMNDVNFCIGEYQVEKLFRELLNEPEPESPRFKASTTQIVRHKELMDIELKRLTNNLSSIFNQDDIFFKRFKK